MLPEGLSPRAPKQFLGCGIPAGNYPFQRLADDGVVTRLYDRRQLGACLSCFRRFRHFPLCRNKQFSAAHFDLRGESRRPECVGHAEPEIASAEIGPTATWTEGLCC